MDNNPMPEWMLELADELGIDRSNEDAIFFAAKCDELEQCLNDEARDNALFRKEAKQRSEEGQKRLEQTQRARTTTAANRTSKALKIESMQKANLDGYSYNNAVKHVAAELGIPEKTLRNQVNSEKYKSLTKPTPEHTFDLEILRAIANRAKK